MKQLRYQLVAVFAWFFFLYNIEKISAPINIATFVYILIFACAVLLLLLPILQRLPLYWSFLGAFIPYLALKLYLGYPIGGANLPITVTEVSAIWLTIILTSQLSRRMEEPWKAVANLTIGSLNKGTQAFELGQGQLYREIRRARLYHRPAALLAVTASNKSIELSLDRFIQDAQRDIIHKYVEARIANLLVNELQDCDVIAQRNSHFIVLLPETNQENVDAIVERLTQAAKQKLDLDLKIGLSTFPDEAVTFESLLEHAEARMERPAQVKDDMPLSVPSANGAY